MSISDGAGQDESTAEAESAQTLQVVEFLQLRGREALAEEGKVSEPGDDDEQAARRSGTTAKCRKCGYLMPCPLSEIERCFRPPSFAITAIVVAPASSEFSIISCGEIELSSFVCA